MTLTAYAFQLRDDGTLKCLPWSAWEEILNRTRPISNGQNRTFNIAEIKFEHSAQQTSKVRFLRLWRVRCNAQGFAEHQEWRMAERPDIKSGLDQLFTDVDGNTDNMLNQFIDSIVNIHPIDLNLEKYSLSTPGFSTSTVSSSTLHSSDMNHEEAFVQSLLAG